MDISIHDELNILTDRAKKRKNRSIPFEEYFGAMNISDEQKEKRIETASLIDEAIKYIFLMFETGKLTQSFLENKLYAELLDVAIKYGQIDDYVNNMVLDMSNDIVSATIRHKNDEYYVSDDRAMFIAEDLANSVQNYFEYQDAMNNYAYKTWHTMSDSLVRTSHARLNNTRVEIDELFDIDGSLMRFPKDIEYNPNPEEVVGCRCWVTYSN